MSLLDLIRFMLQATILNKPIVLAPADRLCFVEPVQIRNKIYLFIENISLVLYQFMNQSLSFLNREILTSNFARNTRGSLAGSCFTIFCSRKSKIYALLYRIELSLPVGRIVECYIFSNLYAYSDLYSKIKCLA